MFQKLRYIKDDGDDEDDDDDDNDGDGMVSAVTINFTSAKQFGKLPY